MRASRRSSPPRRICIPYTTQEFGFGLVVACPDRLMVGDTITIVIESVDGERPYQVGDEAVIETIAAGPAYLTGGVDGTDELTWRVFGTVSQALPDYIVPLASAVPDYTAAGFTLRIAPGGIAFALEDVFSFAVEAGQYRWRSNGGAWRVPADIPADGIVSLPDGLQANFLAGAAPSFVPGDIYTFSVYQPYAVSHVRDAHADAWGWADDAATLDIDFGSAIPVAAIAIARYDLPAGAMVEAHLSADGIIWRAYPLDVSRQVAVLMTDLMQARYLRLTISNADGGTIGCRNISARHAASWPPARSIARWSSLLTVPAVATASRAAQS